MKIKRLVFVFLLALFVGALVNVPAAFVLKQTGLPASVAPNVSVRGVSGTAWSGHIQQLDVATRRGTYTASELKWRLNPLYLFLGKAKVHVTLNTFGGRAESDVSLSVGKTVFVDDLTYSGPLQPWVQMASRGMANAEGYARLTIDEARYALTRKEGMPNWPEHVKAQLLLNQSRIISPMPMLLGDVQADITQLENGVIQAVLNSQKGELDISGNASITSGLQYTTDIKLTPTDKLQSSMRSALGLALPEQSDGSFLVKQKGVLPRQ